MRYALAATALFALTASASAASPRIEKLIADYDRANIGCRSSYVEGETDRQCEARNRISAKLKRAGWCFGRDGLSLAEYSSWHPCNDD